MHTAFASIQASECLLAYQCLSEDTAVHHTRGGANGSPFFMNTDGGNCPSGGSVHSSILPRFV